MPEKYWLEIYGCQMNFAEGYALEIELKQNGWQAAETPEEADAVILHTCSVRQTAENRIWGRIGFFKHMKQEKPLKLIVMGCMAERLKAELQAKEPAIDLVVGNFEKQQLPNLIGDLSRNSSYSISPGGAADQSQEQPFSFQDFHQKENDFHAYVPIMHGCNNFCTYCIVPHVRGREVSRSPAEIKVELQRLEAHGVKEITLLGQNVNSYSYHTEARHYRFPDILKLILDQLDSVKWLRFLTSHPKDVPNELVEMISTEARLCNHIHLPVQHGSSSVLKRMNRKYTRDEYLRTIEHMRKVINEPAITTDIMIGFPGETEQDFRDTLDLMREVEFDDAFMYYFNPREGTPAAVFDEQVPHQTKLDRLSEVIALQREITHSRKMKRVGKVEQVIVESVSKKKPDELLGRTERDHMVVFPGTTDSIGEFVKVKIESMAGNTLKGHKCD
ncbi:MAG: tRNA (N6-isopentenyl adenosine(37)-C2)-methylthiotransferase MiaB [Spirochaetia bacterium]